MAYSTKHEQSLSGATEVKRKRRQDRKQTTFAFRPAGRGGARPGAGRRRSRASRVPHRTRGDVPKDCPLLITLRVLDGVPALRRARFVRAFRESLRRASERPGFRVAHYSIQDNHAHFLVEAGSRERLANGMKSLGARFARCVNRVYGRSDPCDYADTLLAIARDSLEAKPLAMAATQRSLAPRIESILRRAARRNRMTGPKHSLVAALALAVVVPLGSVSIAVARSDSASSDALDHLSARVHALQSDDLSPQRAAVLAEIRTGVNALRQVDLNSEQASHIEIVFGIWSASRSRLPPGDQVGHLATFIHSLFFREDLTPDDVTELEAQLAAQPDIVFTRTRLLRYYSHYTRSRDEDAVRASTEHLVWLIENAPYASELSGKGYSEIDLSFRLKSYVAGKEAWQRHVEREPGNPVFVARYARFVRNGDPGLHIELLHRAKSLDPEDFGLANELGHAYLLRSKYPQGDSHDDKAADKALAMFDRAYELAGDEIPRNYALQGRTAAAFAAGRYGLAKRHARAMLDAFRKSADGDLMHEANTILGRIALIEGDVPRAKAHLLESGKAPTSPVLGSFGPSMALASELLGQGERQVVLDYLELCAVFWDDERLRIWRAAIEGGRKPDFEGNAKR